MNKKVLLQVGCFLVMFVLEMIAAYVDPSSAAFSVLLILAILMIPVFILAGRIPDSPKDPAEDMSETERPLSKAA